MNFSGFAIILLVLLLSPGSKSPYFAGSVKNRDNEIKQIRLADRIPIETSRNILNLSFIGDIMAHDVNYKYEPYSNIYSNVRTTLQRDDLTFGNLEFPIDRTKAFSNYPLFNVKPSYFKAAVTGGVDVFSLANNHITDHGRQSIINTYNELIKNNGIYFSGIDKKPVAALKPVLIQKKGWKIGYLAVTALLNRYEGYEYVNYISYKNRTKRKSFIKYIKETAELYDFFILSIHGGEEYATEADQDKILFFRELVKAGVNIIWAHHPHVLQPWETMVADGRKALILSSCGNFISGQTWFMDPDEPNERRVFTGDSAIFQVRIGKNKGKGEVLDVLPLLISNYKTPDRGMVVDYMENLVKSSAISESWITYYKNREIVIKELLKDCK